MFGCLKPMVLFETFVFQDLNQRFKSWKLKISNKYLKSNTGISNSLKSSIWRKISNKEDLNQLDFKSLIPIFKIFDFKSSILNLLFQIDLKYLKNQRFFKVVWNLWFFETFGFKHLISNRRFEILDLNLWFKSRNQWFRFKSLI